MKSQDLIPTQNKLNNELTPQCGIQDLNPSPFI